MHSRYVRPLNYFILSLIIIDGTFGAIPFGISDTAKGPGEILKIEWAVTIAFMIVTLCLIASLAFNMRKLLNWSTLVGGCIWVAATVGGGVEFLNGGTLDFTTTIALLGLSAGLALVHYGVYWISVTESGYRKHIHEVDYLDS